jgi:hypothetical protein
MPAALKTMNVRGVEVLPVGTSPPRRRGCALMSTGAMVAESEVPVARIVDGLELSVPERLAAEPMEPRGRRTARTPLSRHIEERRGYTTGARPTISFRPSTIGSRSSGST